MAKGIVVYYSRTGNTQKMAEIIAGSMNQAGLATECKMVDKVKADDLLDYDAIVLEDEVYEFLRYAGEHYSPASEYDNVITGTFPSQPYRRFPAESTPADNPDSLTCFFPLNHLVT